MSATSGPQTDADSADERVVMDWSPSGVVTTMWVAMSIMLGLLGFMLFGLIFALFGPSPPESGLAFDAPVVIALTIAALVFHQLLHAGTAQILGATPSFVVDVVQWIFPVFYCQVTGHRFSRRGYLLYLLLPVGALSALGVVFMLVDPRGTVLIIPLALNLGMSMRDIWMAWVIGRSPAEVRVEPRDEGFRLILPRD